MYEDSKNTQVAKVHSTTDHVVLLQKDNNGVGATGDRSD